MFKATWPLWPSVLAFLICAITLIVIGKRFADVVDRLADRTGIGEALAGTLLLGATTSLPGLITTIVAANAGEANLAMSNAMGGIAAQTMFLALADMIYRRANLEHAAASLPNLLQTMILVALIALVLLGTFGPPITFFQIHPITGVLIVCYLCGLQLIRKSQDNPMWRPQHTPETRTDVPDEQAQQESLPQLWGWFLIMAMTVAITGFIIAQAGLSVMAETALSGTIVGGLMTSVVTSLPELVTVIAAVRIGALTLAVGDIIGGNAFDVLFVAAADIAFRDGSIYHALTDETLFILALTILLTSVLAAGMLYRQKQGIGFEGLAILFIYIGGFSTLFFM